ncbi:hypothetical protein ACIRL2_46925 [Embleya sp. NPDC127516]|uniref:hypothetical protein n=1 Tax=Embleya sp. NPDC127516 TaxID=3363990 RepID=UPI00380F67EA
MAEPTWSMPGGFEPDGFEPDFGIAGAAAEGLDPDELCLARARQQAYRIAYRLVTDPFAPETLNVMEDFLDDAAEVQVAYMTVAARDERQLRARLDDLTASRRARRQGQGLGQGLGQGHEQGRGEGEGEGS